MRWQESIRRYGLSRLARGVGVKPQAVASWIEKGRIPAERARDVSRETGIPLHELRPDLWPETVAA